MREVSQSVDSKIHALYWVPKQLRRASERVFVWLHKAWYRYVWMLVYVDYNGVVVGYEVWIDGWHVVAFIHF